ncbi:hypothetical protein CDAR_230371 [Caerostris darwini]|uniref:Uncharacterized protein n=1 Tax=Caerostris darwini TaxID=1538125 RepID=A0AAV4QDN2_9ARAC|nr:hypothetical protein CDAR_230371 [Caerostris darwini]
MDEKDLHLSGSTESIQCSLDNRLSLGLPSIHHRAEETFLLYPALQRFLHPFPRDDPRSSVAGKVHDCGPEWMEKDLRLSGSTESIQCSLDNHLSLRLPSIHHRAEETFLLYPALQRFLHPLPRDDPSSSEAGKVHDCGVN